MATEYVERDRGDAAVMMAQNRYDEEELELTRLLCQLEAWRDCWQGCRCRPGMPVTAQLLRESQRLARCADAFLGW